MPVPFEDALAALREVAPARPGLLALDVSKRAIGLAGADPTWQLATPLHSIRRSRLATDLEALRRVIAERGAAVLVVGWPLEMGGREGRRCQAVGAFVRDLERALGLPVILWDERLTTFEAGETTGAHGHRSRPDRDALAAAVILQDLLDRLRRP
jgi:putative Holliday junction resolvase